MASSIPQTIISRRRTIRLGGVAGLLALEGRFSARAEEGSPLEVNKALVRRLFAEVVNSGNTDILPELYAPVFVNHDTSSRQAPRPAGLPVTLAEFRAAFPNVVVTIDSAVAEGDLVATHESWRDTHPPAGMHLVGRTMHLFRIDGGVIVEQWSAGWEWLGPLTEQDGQAMSNPLMTG
jgi:predicted SnoaL-like aldol condensation-catalyzing enzyme